VSIIKKHIKAVKLISVLLVTAAAAAAAVYMKFFYEPGHGINCFTYKVFGIYCMGCGSTRQLYYALDGQIKKAFYYNVACVIIYPAYAYMYYLLLRWAFADKLPGQKHAYVLAAVAVALIIYMILRNIPLKVFDVLRPAG
jgi:hypothetical protein